jgi:hypothetical protein
MDGWTDGWLAGWMDGWIPKCAHSLNAPCLYIKNWPEDGSLEPKHVANYVLMSIYIYIYVVFD